MEDRIRELRLQGKGKRLIAKELGISITTVGNRLKKMGLNSGITVEKIDNETASQIFNESYPKFEYVSGYDGCESNIIIKCRTCHYTFQYTAQPIRRNYLNIRCSKCDVTEKQIHKELVKLEKQIERDRIAQERTEQKKLLIEAERNKAYTCTCFNCGEMFISKRKGKKYCSSKCMNKYNNSIKKMLKRQRVQDNGDADWSITLSKLIKRDDNVCHICGGKCDSNDYKIVNGSFVVGMNYPSIDHVLPISKGGKHIKNNIKLAHIICNSIKNNKDIFISKSGQLKMSI